MNIWMIAALRNHVFYSITDMNHAIADLIEQINNKKSRHLKASRRERFEEMERGTLALLPSNRYDVVEWQDGLLVPRDYHILCAGDYYSVPHALVGKRVNCAVSRTTIRIFISKQVNPVAVHSLGRGEGQTVTCQDHMPVSHRAYAADTLEELLIWAKSIGPDACDLFSALRSNSRITPFSALRQMSRAKRLAREYGPDRFISACKYANTVGTQTIDSVLSILKNDIDLKKRAAGNRVVAVPVSHENVRGAQAYNGDDHAG